MSGVYASKTVRKRRHARPRRRPYLAIGMVVVGALLVAGAGIAAAAVLLHGRGWLSAPALQTSDLKVSDLRLSRALAPGGSADLLFKVRNTNTFGVRVDQVTLVGALSQAKPAGCTSKVTGPITKPAGYRLPASEQKSIGGGQEKSMVLKAVFALAKAAKSGCGFRVQIQVTATQLVPATTPPTTKKVTTPPAPVTGPGGISASPLKTSPAVVPPPAGAVIPDPALGNTPPAPPAIPAPGWSSCNPTTFTCIVKGAGPTDPPSVTGG